MVSFFFSFFFCCKIFVGILVFCVFWFLCRVKCKVLVLVDLFRVKFFFKRFVFFVLLYKVSLIFRVSLVKLSCFLMKFWCLKVFLVKSWINLRFLFICFLVFFSWLSCLLVWYWWKRILVWVVNKCVILKEDLGG